jgi:phage terminase large subunit
VRAALFALVCTMVSSAIVAEAQANLLRWQHEPQTFFRQVLKFEPDAWQEKGAAGLMDPAYPITAFVACKGPGKTRELGGVAWWRLTCFRDAQGGALSITQDNLRDNLWKELSYLRSGNPILEALFEQTATQITIRAQHGNPDTWFLSARSFAKSADASEQANSLAGLHGPWPFWVLDETGDMDPGVIGGAKGILAVEGQRGLIVAAGNPTTRDGALYYLATVDPHTRVIHITGDPDDPGRSPRISLDWARAEIASLGRDNPWVMVNILGQFPPVGANQLIGPDDVIAAQQRDLPFLAYQSDPIIWGLDPARSDASGADEAALARRQGVLARKMYAWRGLDGTQLGDAVARMITDAPKDHGGTPDAVFVDVAGVGASAFDRLVHLGWEDVVMPVDFGGKAAGSGKYHNKRAEMWADMAAWLKGKPACLPNDAVLRAELQAPRFFYRVINKKTAFILESKDDMKKRGVRSPNRADALALTFAAPVNPRGAHDRNKDGGNTRVETEYDPLAGVV